MARVEEEITLRSFLREFRWIMLGFLLIWLLLFALDVKGLRTELGVPEAVLVGVVCPVLVGPAAWLRWYQLDHARTARFWAALALALGWLIGGAVAIGFVFDHLLLD